MRLTLVFVLWSVATMGQQKIIADVTASCSQSRLKQNLYYLTDSSLRGRLMGSHGDTLASQYVAECFRDNQLQAPYENGTSYFQAITAYRQLDQQSLMINTTGYAPFDGWNLYPGTPVNLKNIPVLLADYDSWTDFYHDLPEMDVDGKAVCFSGKVSAAFFQSNIDSMEAILKNKGARLVIIKRTSDKGFAAQKAHSFLPTYEIPLKEFHPTATLPEISISPIRFNSLLGNDRLTADSNGHFNLGKTHYLPLKATITIVVTRELKAEHAPNVIGILPGKDTSLACIVISAHHDHDGVNGKDIYYGAVDNASGTVAMMEIAAMLKRAALSGLKPKRTIVFASYTGEERGLLGSCWYADHPVYPMNKTFAVINIDMLGRVDTLHSGRKPDSTNYAYILVKDDVGHGLRKALYEANDASVNVTLDTYYENPEYTPRRLKGSDQYPLYLQGVPFVRIDCGFCQDYHQPTDTPDKINYELLTKQTKLAFNTLWDMANL